MFRSPHRDSTGKGPVNHIVDVNVPITENNRKYLGKVEIQGVVTLEDGTIVPHSRENLKPKIS